MFKLEVAQVVTLKNLISKNVKVDVNSGAIAKVNASYSLDVSASSGAIVQYKGNPEVNSNVKKRRCNHQKID